MPPALPCLRLMGLAGLCIVNQSVCMIDQILLSQRDCSRTTASSYRILDALESTLGIIDMLGLWPPASMIQMS